MIEFGRRAFLSVYNNGHVLYCLHIFRIQNALNINKASLLSGINFSKMKISFIKQIHTAVFWCPRLQFF